MDPPNENPFVLPELLPNADWVPPKVDGLLLPKEDADPLADAAIDPNPPLVVVLLVADPKADDPKTGALVLGADAARAPNPPLVLLLLPKTGVLLEPPSADGLPKTGAVVFVVVLEPPSFDGLPKTGAAVFVVVPEPPSFDGLPKTGAVVFVVVPETPSADGLPNAGPAQIAAELALGAPNAGVLPEEEPNPPVVLPDGLALNAENGLAAVFVALLLPPNGLLDGFPNGDDVVPNAEPLPNMGVLLAGAPNANADLEDSLFSPLPSDGTSFPEASISPQAEITTSTIGFCALLVSTLLIFSRSSIPSWTSPNTTCLPFKYGTALSVKKNCEEFVFLPLLAIESSPFLEWFRNPDGSSGNFPQASPCSLLGA